MDSKSDLPPSYYDVTGITTTSTRLQRSTTNEEQPTAQRSYHCTKTPTKDLSQTETVSIDVDSIQVTFQYTNVLCEQSETHSLHDYEIPQRLPGIHRDISSNNMHPGHHEETVRFDLKYKHVHTPQY